MLEIFKRQPAATMIDIDFWHQILPIVCGRAGRGTFRSASRRCREAPLPPNQRDARGRKLMMVIWREETSYLPSTSKRGCSTLEGS
jgi:hypothetical protein